MSTITLSPFTIGTTPAAPFSPPSPGNRPRVGSRYIKWFADTTIDDIPSVGGKNASLGEMYRELTSKGVQVPDGFAITADAFREFLSLAGLDAKIASLLEGLNAGNVDSL